MLLSALLLLGISFVTGFLFRSSPVANLEEKALERYLHRQEADFNKFLTDTPMLRRLVQQNEPFKNFEQLTARKYGIYLYAETLFGQDLIFWNSNQVMPDSQALKAPEGVFFQRFSNGYYVVRKQNLQLPGMTNRVQAYALIPIYYLHNNRSRYLTTRFAHDEHAHQKINLSMEQTPFAVASLDKKPLFYILRKPYTPTPSADTLSFLLRMTALLLFAIYLHLIAEGVVRRKGALRGVGLLVGSLLVLRVLVFLLPEFFHVQQFRLFSPGVYGSNWLHPTLGDLLLNAAVFCWMVLFAWYQTGAVKHLPGWLHGKRKYFAGGLALFVLILATFQMADVVRTLVSDSTISFQVNDFFTLDSFTVVGFVVLALLSLGYYYFSRLLFRFIFPAFEKRFYLIYFIIGLAGLLYLSLLTGNPIVLFQIPVLLWLLVYTFLVCQQQFIINRFRITLAGVLFWIFVFSASLSLIVLQENRIKEEQWKTKLAEQQDQKSDPSQERTLSIGLIYLDNEFFLKNFDRFRQPASNRLLRDSITRENSFTTYLKAYATQLYVFDSAQNGLFNDDGKTFAELNNVYTNRSKPTQITNLYYHEPSYDQVIYLTKREVQDSGRNVGTVFIVSTPTNFTGETFLPELFSNVGRNDIESSPVYAYAVYQKGILQSQQTKYPFKTSLTYRDVPTQSFETRSNGEYDELWYKVSGTKIVVITKKRDRFLESITLFSYLFCSFLFMVALLHLLALLLRAAYGWKIVSLFSEISIRSQVHGTIIFVSLLSFLIIGAATITFFVQRYNRNNIDKISRTSGIVMREMQNRIRNLGSLQNAFTVGDSAASQDLQRLVNEVAQIHFLDVNLYDVQGELRYSSIEEVYKRGVLSTKMQPLAFYHLNRMRQAQFVQEEDISELKYLSYYAAVQEPESGEVLAYLNIPYFTSQIDLQQEISNFLVTIINLNAFIFLISGIIALFITNRITRSFSVIGDKMRAIQLGRTNEEIVWNRKDEIGELVVQYNKMVHQLEASAAALAKSEREGAWREMARQVAHEIKNPLTPMKLSIQYLQKAINSDQPNVQELTERVAGTLVEQIDHLSKIAADFSRFANIGNQQVERFDLHDVLESVVQLYRANPKLKLLWRPVPAPVWIDADKTHINRLFANLFSNAVEACNSNEECIIKLEEALEENKILIRVKDNGEGIPVGMQDKIFVPNFTTKSSGTGLGLAMSKGIVEQAGGRIWFETGEGAGTTFFVELPMSDY
ncbi:hypothetical protein BUE76_10425 [Cnuella takakiae]|nr:hypothetical protein BUE76_10425 [Cnuella takakiae]